MDTCEIENCGEPSVEGCEICGRNFCRKHGKKDDFICMDCKVKEDSGEDAELF